MAITSPGIGSGLDVNGIVSKLMAIEQQPLQALNTKEASYQAQISAYGSLKGSLASLQNALAGLKDASKFSTLKATTSTSDYLTATASATAATGSFSVEVQALAQAQKVKSGLFTNTNTAVGQGKVTIQFGTYDSTSNTFSANPNKSPTTITINPADSSLAGIRDAINRANAGVNASIINDGSGNRLIISSKDSGTANSLKITVEDSDGNNDDGSGLSQIAFDQTKAAGSGKNMTETLSAQDAKAVIDGIPITKSSNLITDAIEGVSLNLTKAEVGKTTTVTVNRDNSDGRKAVESFVKAYNDAIKALGDASKYDASTKTSAILQGDATVRTAISQLRTAISTPLTAAAGGFRRLSDIGITQQQNGTLAIDSTKLGNAFSDTTKDVAALFASMGKSTDSLVSFTSANKNAQPGSYAVNITQLATQGKLVGSAAPTYTIDDSNKTLTFKVDGTSATVTLATGNYSPKQLIAEIQSKVNGAGAISSAGSSVAVGFDGTQAKLTGSTAANLAAAGGTTLNIGLDGGTGQDITLAASYANPGDLVNDLQSKINTAFGAGKIQVEVKDGVLSLTSPSYGSTSQITLAGAGASALFGTTTTASGTGSGALKITSNKYGSTSDVTVSGDGASSLFGASRTNTVGVNVAGTIGGNPALGSGQDLTGSSGGADGLKLTIKGDTLGDRGTVTFDRGFAQHLDQVLTGLLDSKGIFNAKTDGINATIKDIGKRRDELSTRLTALEARYRAQYTALDTLLSKMNQTSTYLTQQLASLSK